MSMQSPQQKEAGEMAKWQAALSQQLAGVAFPELQAFVGPEGYITSLLGGTAGGTKKSLLDEEAYQRALGTLRSGYAQAGMTGAEQIGYMATRSGEGRLSPGAVSSSIGQAATSLERDRMAALRNLEFMSAQTSMADYIKLLQLTGQGTQTALSLAGGFGGAATSALGGLSQTSPGAGALGGAMSGASLGSVAGLPGMIFGGIAGGVMGAYGWES